MLPFVLLAACGPDAPENIPERIKENCQREFGTQGRRAVDNCIRWSEVPPRHHDNAADLKAYGRPES